MERNNPVGNRSGDDGYARKLREIENRSTLQGDNGKSIPFEGDIRDFYLPKVKTALPITAESLKDYYVSMGKVRGGTAPILADGIEVYSNPLPHVLMLTAIVVGVGTTAVALALTVRIKEAYDSIEEDEILEQDPP